MSDLNSIGGLHYEMMKRCYNENSVAYKDYGAKGIKVCKEWHDREIFRKWAKENGYVKGLRLERIDSKKNYEPSNCQFGEKKKKKSGGESQYRKEVRKHREEMIRFAGCEKKYSKSRLYSIYKSMLTRCNNKNHKYYKHYGGRGIRICEEWSGKDGFFYFHRWALDNGYDPELTIDRINVNGDYQPDNCKWATMKEQRNNTRNSKRVVYKGEEFTVKNFSIITGISKNIIYQKLKENMTGEKIIESQNSK